MPALMAAVQRSGGKGSPGPMPSSLASPRMPSYEAPPPPCLPAGFMCTNCTPCAARLRSGLARLKTNVTLAALIREAQPYQRQVIIMRDPVDRYYSAFHYYRRSPKDPFEGPDKFHARVLQDIKRWSECVAKESEAECVKRYDPQQLVKGMYSEFLPDWLNHWPRCADLTCTARWPLRALKQSRTQSEQACPEPRTQRCGVHAKGTPNLLCCEALG